MANFHKGYYVVLWLAMNGCKDWKWDGRSFSYEIMELRVREMIKYGYCNIMVLTEDQFNWMKEENIISVIGV